MLGRKIVLGTSGNSCAHHVLTKLLGARVRIVVRPIPIDGFVFRHHFVLPLARHGHGAHMAEAPQPVIVLSTARASCSTSSVPRRFTFRQLFSDFRFNDAAQWIIESVVWMSRS